MTGWCGALVIPRHVVEVDRDGAEKRTLAGDVISRKFGLRSREAATCDAAAFESLKGKKTHPPPFCACSPHPPRILVRKITKITGTEPILRSSFTVRYPVPGYERVSAHHHPFHVLRSLLYTTERKTSGPAMF